MAWIYGTVTGTQELAAILSEAAIGTSLQAINAVAVAGTGYLVADELTISGGTFTIAAIAEVLTVGGSGEVLTVRIRNAGLYQSAPSNNVSTTGGGGSACELTCTFALNDWERVRATNVAGAAQSAVVSAGGTGYTIGDIITIAAGTGNAASTFRVLTVSGGVVLTVEAVAPGSYTVPPSNPAAVTGGTGGDNCTLTVTYGDGTSEAEIILKGPGTGGTDDIYCGWLTYEQDTNRHMELAGFSGHDQALTWENQPGISPGRSGSNGGHYCPTHQISMSFWISVSPRRLLFDYKASTFYGSGHVGFLNTYATAGEWPYPLYVAGCTTLSADGITSIDEPNGSCANPPGREGSYGAGSLRTADGTWQRIRNTDDSGNNHVRETLGGLVWPWGIPSSAVTLDGDDFAQMTSSFLGSSGPFAPILTIAHTYRIYPTPNAAGDLFLRVPATLIRDATDIFGVIEGAFAVSSAALLVPENRISDGDSRYTVFGSNVTTTDQRGFWCIEEQ